MHDGTTPLILAARLAAEGMVEELINCHADVNAIDDFGKISVFCCLNDHLYCLGLSHMTRTRFGVVPTLGGS